MELAEYGWDSALEESFAPHAALGLTPARVVKQLRDLSTLVTGQGELPGEVSGRFRHTAGGPADYPAVGDWAAVNLFAGGSAIIEALLPRRSAFTRKAAGEAVEAQIVAANVDMVFLVSGLDGDFNLRRIERYVTAAWSSGAAPIIVLNKSDLRRDLEDVVAETAGVAPGVPIVPASAHDERGLDGLAPYLVPRKTIAFLGSSGVGKSTMINRLLGEERLLTAEVSDAAAVRRRSSPSRRLIMVDFPTPEDPRKAIVFRGTRYGARPSRPRSSCALAGTMGTPGATPAVSATTSSRSRRRSDLLSTMMGAAPLDQAAVT